ncbi:hypothetical protein [Streptomyces sp. 039-1]
MGVNAAYAEMVAAMLAGDAETAAEHAANIAEWIGKGGFLPDALKAA